MAMPWLLSRSASPHHFALLTAFILIFVVSLSVLGFIPGREGFTVTEVYGNDRLAHQTGPQQEPFKTVESIAKPGHFGVNTQNSADTCKSGLEYLKDLGLSRNIKYSRKCIQPVFPDDVDRDAIAKISLPLITNTTTVNLDDLCSTDLESLPCETMELPVPKPDPESVGQYGHLLFGIATNSKRLRDSKESFGHWLANSDATLVCMVTDDPEELLGLKFEALEAEYAAAGMKLRLVGRQDMQHTPEQAHMMLIRNLLSFSSSSPTPIHWLGILDDDTFFPSLHALSTELARHDHTRSRYLGALTESADALHQGVLAAWGGAGIFLSLALAREIEPHLDGCLSGRGGDVQIMACIHAHSHARLTTVEGLWQMDFMGDTAGIYESGRRMLSMHHWKSWHWLPVHKMAALTRICGDCFLERFVFDAPDDDDDDDDHQRRGSNGDAKSLITGHGATVLNVGYSINVYSEGLPDLSRVEQTWDGTSAWKDYEWSVGPLRPRVSRQEKKTWWLKTVLHGDNGKLSQVYLHEGKEEGKADEVIELIWASS